MIRIINKILYYFDKLFKRPNVDNGFIETTKKQIDKRGDYTMDLGFVGKKEIKVDADCRNFEPAGEQQNIDFEKMHCVSESALNSIETKIN